MAKYRKRPIVVEAMQYIDTYDGRMALMAFTESDNSPYSPLFFSLQGAGEVYLALHNSWVPFKPGDWIIKDPAGVGFYPCEEVVFGRTYELIEADEHRIHYGVG